MSVKKTVFLLLLLLLGIGLFLLAKPKNSSADMNADSQRLLTESYDGIFLSMYDISHFKEEDFVFYRGLSILTMSHKYQNTSEIATQLQQAFQGTNPITNIYLGLDPELMWNASRQNTERWNQSLEQDILSYVEKHSAVSFEVMLPFPIIDYWRDKSAEERNTLLTVYRSLIYALTAYPNVTVYYPGTEEWLIGNPGNYTDTFVTNEYLTLKLMLLTFCDRHYQVTSDNVSSYFEQLNAVTEKESSYPDLTNWCLVFFGDSIFGNYKGSISIPGAVNGLSGASVYNCAEGGTMASNEPDFSVNFPSMAEAFINQDLSFLEEEHQFTIGLKEYLADNHAGKALCFVINFGLNDYFNGNAVNDLENASYATGLELGLSKLRKAFPNARFLVLSPSYCSIFTNGTEILSQRGSVLTDYVAAALDTARRMNAHGINLYSELGVNSENQSRYLDDGCHLNEAGRFKVAELILKHMETLSKQ